MSDYACMFIDGVPSHCSCQSWLPAATQFRKSSPDIAIITTPLSFLVAKFVIKQKYITRTRQVLEEYGEFKAVLLARVIPIVRTFINPVVGAVGMDLKRFTLANIVGGLVWSVGVTLLGYALGSSINIDKYILPITAVIVLVSLIPVVREISKQRRAV